MVKTTGWPGSACRLYLRMLTEDQKNHYHSQGYLVLEKAIATKDIERIESRCTEDCR